MPPLAPATLARFDAPCARRTVAGVVLLRADGAALLQHRDDRPDIQDPGLWVVPGGHVDPGESPATGATREFLEETDYDCRTTARPLAHWRSEEVGYAPGFDLFFLWALYDGRQPVICHEGQALAFVPRADAETLPRRDYLTRIWDLALSASGISKT